jgi:hypothetical protein
MSTVGPATLAINDARPLSDRVEPPQQIVTPRGVGLGDKDLIHGEVGQLLCGQSLEFSPGSASGIAPDHEAVQAFSAYPEGARHLDFGSVWAANGGKTGRAMATAGKAAYAIVMRLNNCRVQSWQQKTTVGERGRRVPTGSRTPVFGLRTRHLPSKLPKEIRIFWSAAAKAAAVKNLGREKRRPMSRQPDHETLTCKPLSMPGIRCLTL